VVFGLVRKSEIKEEALLPFYKLASADSLKFNVVSCMFAIHYMFETTTTLNNFVKNVSDLLNVGGYFIGTCLDGYLVHQALKGKTEINGFYYGENGEQIRNWGIVKKYDRYELKNHLKNIGKAIEVYMESFGQWLEEYLVDYDMLVEYLAKENIRPVISPKELELLGLNASTGSFKEIYNEIEHPEEDGDLDGFNEMFKEYSFMNRWFIFKKY
jgi:SAM-dependent methyltransferase